MAAGSRSRRLLLRFRCGAGVGWGHATRCLALGAWAERSGWTVIVASRAGDTLPPAAFVLGGLVHRVPVEDWDSPEAFEAFVATVRPDSIVLDEYDIDGNLIGAGAQYCPIALIDDFGLRSGSGAQLVVNQNPYAAPALYPGFDHRMLLLGLDYVLLPPSDIGRSGAPSTGRNVLVTFGGADPLHLTEVVVDGIDGLGVDCNVRVLCPGARSIDREMSKAGGLELLPASDQMGKHLEWADYVVGSFGGTLWESLFRGLPGVWVKAVDSHDAAYRWMITSGCGLAIDGMASTGKMDLLSGIRTLVSVESLSESIKKAGIGLIDGLGGARVVERLEEVMT